MKILSFLAALAGAALLAACYPVTTAHPVGAGNVGDRPLDLRGLWRGRTEMGDDKTPAYFHFLPRKDGAIDMLIVARTKEPGDDWMAVRLTQGRAGSYSFVNAQVISNGGRPDNDHPNGTIPALAVMGPDARMTLFLANEAKVRALIKNGDIKGTVEEGQFGDAVITEDPAALDAYLAKHAAELFTDKFASMTKGE